MYLRTGESFVTQGVLAMPDTASSSGYLSHNVKHSFLSVPACMSRPMYRTDKPMSLSSVRNTRPRSFRTAYRPGVRKGKQRMTNT